ncbi:MAG: DUF4120 family protein [Labilithrix sp.]|nr:DUF4120 family protein [Labilithrix sp.]
MASSERRGRPSSPAWTQPGSVIPRLQERRKMLVIEDQKHFDRVVEFAKKSGLYEDDGKANYALSSRLKYLENYGGKNSDGSDRMRVRLMPDGAPMSFYFVIETKNAAGQWGTLFNGGLLFHDRHDGNGSGAAPTFAVTLEPTTGWSIHT